PRRLRPLGLRRVHRRLRDPGCVRPAGRQTRRRDGARLMAKKPKGPKQILTLLHEEARRRNIPTAELQSTAEQLEEMRPPEPVRYPRATPLPQGAKRERDEDLDPQIVWNGARIRLTPAQVAELVEKNEVEVGDPTAPGLQLHRVDKS